MIELEKGILDVLQDSADTLVEHLPSETADSSPPEEIPKFSPWTPWGQARLLFWLFTKPQLLQHYIEQPDTFAPRLAAAALVGSLLILPLMIPGTALVLGAFPGPSLASLPLAAGGIALGWALAVLWVIVPGLKRGSEKLEGILEILWQVWRGLRQLVGVLTDFLGAASDAASTVLLKELAPPQRPAAGGGRSWRGFKNLVIGMLFGVTLGVWMLGLVVYRLSTTLGHTSGPVAMLGIVTATAVIYAILCERVVDRLSLGRWIAVAPVLSMIFLSAAFNIPGISTLGDIIVSAIWLWIDVIYAVFIGQLVVAELLCVGSFVVFGGIFWWTVLGSPGSRIKLPVLHSGVLALIVLIAGYGVLTWALLAA
jgi:hypothetical protein